MIVVKNLHKTYRTGLKEVRAVNGVDLEIGKGKTVAVVGPSGAGKSTLLHLLGGLDSPTKGEVSIGGVSIYKLSDRTRAKIRNESVGFVFQFYHLLPEFTALENVMLPALIRDSWFVVRGSSNEKRNTKNETRERAASLLKSVGLSHRMSHRPNELSGGETQRVAIARALMNEPQILLCDEPTGNLDSKMSESILELLFELKSRRDMTLIIVTHDGDISSRAEKTLHLRDGRIV